MIPRYPGGSFRDSCPRQNSSSVDHGNTSQGATGIRRSQLGSFLAPLFSSLALTAALLAATTTGAAAAPLAATLEGVPIPLDQVAGYDCHDRDYPVIRCFRSLARLATDEQRGVPSATASPTLLSPFVRWCRDVNYGIPCFEAYNSYADLSLIGWNDQISSFTPLNGGHPVWWQHANYAGLMWDWGTLAVATVGSANDQISSVQKR